MLGLCRLEAYYDMPPAVAQAYLVSLGVRATPGGSSCYGVFMNGRDLQTLLTVAGSVVSALSRLDRMDDLQHAAASAVVRAFGGPHDPRVVAALCPDMLRLVAIYAIAGLHSTKNGWDGERLSAVARTLDIDPDADEYADTEGGRRRLCADVGAALADRRV